VIVGCSSCPILGPTSVASADPGSKPRRLELPNGFVISNELQVLDYRIGIVIVFYIYK